jgi:hypothetical protein
VDKDLTSQFAELLTGPDIVQAVNEANKAHLVNYTSLYLMLVDKGIIEAEEWDRYRMMATSVIDQHWTQKLDDQKKEVKELLDQMEKEAPGISKIFGFLLKDKEKENE